jgi:hypothetical protein
VKNGSRGISIGTEDVNRDRPELETAFPRCDIIHPEQLVYVRISVEKGGCLPVLSKSSRISDRPRGREQERATLERLRKHDTTVTSMNAFRCKKRQERLVPNIVLGTIVGKRDLCGQAYNGEHWYIPFSRVTMLVLWIDVETY